MVNDTLVIGVVGSRTGFTVDHIAYILNCCDATSFISGGAMGVDTFVKHYANKSGIPIEVIRPVNPSNKMSYLYRNIEIITKADMIIAFWDGESRGTKFVIDYARARGMIVDIVGVKK